MFEHYGVFLRHPCSSSHNVAGNGKGGETCLVNSKPRPRLAPVTTTTCAMPHCCPVPVMQHSGQLSCLVLKRKGKLRCNLCQFPG